MLLWPGEASSGAMFAAALKRRLPFRFVNCFVEKNVVFELEIKVSVTTMLAKESWTLRFGAVSNVER
jgi:hypothetical protein